MSTQIAVINGTGRARDAALQLNRFWGGDAAGEMLQLTQGFGTEFGPDEPGFIQLTPSDAYRLIGELARWLKTDSQARAQRIREEIAKCHALEKTIISEAVECERFIAELQVIEIPLRLLEMFGSEIKA